LLPRVLCLLLAMAGCGTTTPGGPSDAAPHPGDDGGTPGADGSAAADGGVAHLAVGASQNLLALDSCQVTPAQLPNVPAGTYTIRLDSSTLSKGSVPTSPPAPSFDNYVVVHLPIPAGDPQQDHRFFMLNGVGASYSVTLAEPGTIEVMFVDSDSVANSGQATVTLTPGDLTVTVDAVANVLRWQEGCNSSPATMDVSARGYSVTLLQSSLSSGSGSEDDFVILRLPSEVPQDDYRYVMLNGVEASHTFTALTGGTLRAWFISAGTGDSGEASLGVSAP